MIVKENVPIRELTTMRMGGAARYVVEVRGLGEVREAYELAEEKGLPVFVLGGGANTIGRDGGFEGVIIVDKLKGMEVFDETDEGVMVRAMGGESWDDLVEFTCERGLTGIEAMSAIPGTVGAAPVQNIGAYGQEIGQVIDHVEAYDTWKKELVVLSREEMKMGYRRTIFNEGPEVGRYFIVAVVLELEEGEMKPPFYNSLQRYIEEHGVKDFSPMSVRKMVQAVRGAKLPDPAVEASAGSFFKNVYLGAEEAEEARQKGWKVWKKADGREMVNAGWLLEEAGLKGKKFHGMRVSEKAALILINDEAEGYGDLARAREEIRGVVREKFGVELEQEPVEVGGGVSGGSVASGRGGEGLSIESDDSGEDGNGDGLNTRRGDSEGGGGEDRGGEGLGVGSDDGEMGGEGGEKD